MGNWQTVAAEAFCASVRDGTHDSPRPVPQGKKLITSRHIIGGRIDLDNAYEISDADFAAINRRSKVDQWDVLLTMIGTVGEPCLVREQPTFAIKNIGLFKSKDELHGRWLYYYLRSPQTQRLILERSAGTTQSYISLGALRELPVAAPSNPNEMRAISSVLGALDDKIDLNRSMNESLESVARAIFKDWFVDFGPTRAKMDGGAPYLAPEIWSIFPDRLDVEGTPQRWTSRPLNDVLDIASGGTPKTSVAAYWGGTIPWFSVADTPSASDLFVLDTQKHITQDGLASCAASLLPVGVTIITARGTVGKLAITGSAMAMNQSCYGVSGKAPLGMYLTYFLVRDAVRVLQSNTHGSIFDTITRETFKAVSAITPSSECAYAFEQTVAAMMERILCNVRESAMLAATRDLLLPKLMSGEIRVTDAEHVMEASL